MTKEQQPQTLTELKTREQKLQDGLAKTEFVLATFGGPQYANRLTGKLGRTQIEAEIEEPIKTAQVVERLTGNALPYFETQLATVQSQIKQEEDEKPKSIAAYLDHQLKLTRAENYVTTSRKYLASGQIRPDQLQKAETYYAEQLDRGQDPQIKQGEMFYRQLAKEVEAEVVQKPDTKTPEKKQEAQAKPETEPAPRITIDRNANTIKIEDGNPHTLTKPQMALIVRLAKNPNREVSPKTLHAVLKNTGANPSRYFLGFTIKKIRAKIEIDHNNPKILTTVGVTKGARYILRATSVEFVGESAKARKSKEGHKIFNFTLPDGLVVKIQGKQNSDLLKLLLTTNVDNQAQSEDLAMALYGKTDRKSRVNITQLIRRIKLNLKPHNWTVVQSTPKEEQLYRKGIKKSEQKLKKAKYYLEKITPDKKVAKEPTFGLQVSHLLAVDYILGNPHGDIQQVIEVLGTTKKNRRFTTGQAAFAAKRANALLFYRAQKGIATEDELKLKAAIESKIGLKDKEARVKIKELINDFFRVVHAVDEKQTAQKKVEAPAPEPQTTSSTQPLSEKTPKITKIEGRLPDIRSQISLVLDLAKKQNAAPTMSGPQVQRIYGLSTKFINQAQERGYISPERGRDHHATYTLEEVATLIFLKNNGNGLSAREVKELRRLIREDIANREGKIK